MKYVVFLCMLLIMLSSCLVLKENNKTVIIEFEQTPCSGYCPTYKVQIFSDKTMIWNGIENVDKIGNYNGSLSQDEYTELLNTFEQIRFFDLQDSYKSFMMDLPTKFITYHKDGKMKTIRAYDNIPKELLQLIRKLEDTFKNAQWKKD